MCVLLQTKIQKEELEKARNTLVQAEEEKALVAQVSAQKAAKVAKTPVSGFLAAFTLQQSWQVSDICVHLTGPAKPHQRRPG